MGRLLKRSLYSDPDHRNRVVAKRTIGKTVLDVGGYSDCADYFANKTYVCVNKPIPLHKHRRFDSKRDSR